MYPCCRQYIYLINKIHTQATVKRSANALPCAKPLCSIPTGLFADGKRVYGCGQYDSCQSYSSLSKESSLQACVDKCSTVLNSVLALWESDGTGSCGCAVYPLQLVTDSAFNAYTIGFQADPATDGCAI